MRTLFILGLGLAACSVPDKKLAPDDAGTDTAAPMDAPSDAPETTITMAPPEFSRSAAATFEFSSNLATATFECSIDGEMPVGCSSPYTRSLGDGSHTFSVRASDASGNNDDTPAEHVWSIDTVAPDTMFTETPPVADNSTSVRFSFEAGERNAEFDCSLDGGAYAACTSGSMFGPITDGAHSFAVRARDRAGNLDAMPAIFAWSVDTSTPDTQLIAGPSGPQAETTAQFTFFSPDAGGGATFECKLDAGAFAACTSPADLVALTEGNHTFSVRVRDAVGNLDPSPATRTWSVDLTPPETTILTGPTGLVAQASASFTFSSNETGVTYACSFDGAAFVACDSPETAMALAQGAHTFGVRATDAAGHTDGSPASRAWTVDTIAPGITITSGPAQNGASGPRVVVGFTVTEGVVTCSLDSGAFAPCAMAFAANLPAGPHNVRIRAADGAGNVTTVTRAFTVACAAPDATGASGLLHLDDTGQALANEVAGGPEGVLGSDGTVEVADPAATTGRFGGALVFAAAESDHATWPLLLPAGPDITVELWTRPDAIGGSRTLASSTDGSFALRVNAGTATTVSIAVTVGTKTVSSAAITAGTWHHVVTSQTGGALQLWVDGVKTEIAGAADAYTLDILTLGGSGGAAYSGAIDEVWVGQTGIALDEGALVRYCPL
jgi:hypothetical protein